MVRLKGKSKPMPRVRRLAEGSSGAGLARRWVPPRQGCLEVCLSPRRATCTGSGVAPGTRRRSAQHACCHPPEGRPHNRAVAAGAASPPSPPARRRALGAGLPAPCRVAPRPPPYMYAYPSSVSRGAAPSRGACCGNAAGAASEAAHAAHAAPATTTRAHGVGAAPRRPHKTNKHPGQAQRVAPHCHRTRPMVYVIPHASLPIEGMLGAWLPRPRVEMRVRLSLGLRRGGEGRASGSRAGMRTGVSPRPRARE
eukprot:scaffold4958_cov406-Prasinococcus_capsulatus_cf.AAC.23